MINFSAESWNFIYIVIIFNDSILLK